MKHIKIIARINTLLAEDYAKVDELKKNESAYIEAANKAYRYAKSQENEKRNESRFPNRVRSLEDEKRNILEFNKKRYKRLVVDINDELKNDWNEKSSIFAISIDNRKISFALKVNIEWDEKILTDVENKIKVLIEKQISEYLYENEKYDNVSFTTSELSIKEFYFDIINEAQDFGLDVDDYMKSIKEYQYGADFDRYNRCAQYLYEDQIEGKLSKEEFYNKYKVLLYNKTFKEEIDRIYNSKNEYNVVINPVHYELTSYDRDERIEMFKALAVALYSNNRIKNKKILRMKIDIVDSYVSNDTLQLILKNSKDSFVFLEFEADRDNRRFTREAYFGRTEIRTKELTDNIKDLKDEVLFAIYVDKYQDKVHDNIYDELIDLNFVRFEDKLMPEAAIEYAKFLAKEAKIEVTDRLIKEVLISQDDLTRKEAKAIFEDYKQYIIQNKYFPEYKDFYTGIGNVDNYVDPYDQLMAMPGLDNVKRVVNEILTYHKMDVYKKEHFLEYKNKEGIKSRFNGNSLPMHMVFMGNAGTCKTTVAKMIAKILKSRGIIKNDRTEIYGTDGRCYHLENAFKYAYGGVLFIDEAYSLSVPEITDLIALMENHRNDVIVILAGYTADMRGMMHVNQGLNSRIKYKIEFEDYTEDELWEVLKYQAKEQKYKLSDGVKEKVMPIFGSCQCDKEMGNGRLARNMLDMAIMNQASRYKDVDFEKEKPSFESLNELTPEDFDLDVKAITGKAGIRIIGNVDPEIELNNMIGIKNIKTMLNKIISSAYMSKVRKEKADINNKNLISTPLHFAFLGNPGTAKTTVARLIARILKKKGVIKKDNIVEVGRSNLVGQFVGQTAPLVKSQFAKAKGGVLFIDEAYSLIDDREGSFGDEAINTIIQEMENHRDDVIVIFAGYTDRMRKFIERNEGLRSRLSYILEFNDYNEEELYGIFEKFLSDEKLTATDDAKNKVKEILRKISKNKDFGNGRFIRKMIENAKLNMDYRLSLKKDEYTKDELMTFEAVDFDDLESDEVLEEKNNYAMGFVA